MLVPLRKREIGSGISRRYYRFPEKLDFNTLFSDRCAISRRVAIASSIAIADSQSKVYPQTHKGGRFKKEGEGSIFMIAMFEKKTRSNVSTEDAINDL